MGYCARAAASAVPVKFFNMAEAIIKTPLVDVDEEGVSGVVSSLVNSFAQAMLASG